MWIRNHQTNGNIKTIINDDVLIEASDGPNGTVENSNKEPFLLAFNKTTVGATGHFPVPIALYAAGNGLSDSQITSFKSITTTLLSQLGAL